MKIIQYIKYLFILVSVISISTLFFMDEASAVNIMLIWAYILMGIAVVALIVMPVLNIAKNPKGTLRSLFGLLGLLVVAALLFAFSSSTPVIGSDGTVFDNVATLKLTDTGLYLAYFALIAAIVVSFFGEIRNSFK